MRDITINLVPFDFTQTIYYKDNDGVMRSLKSTVDNVPADVYWLLNDEDNVNNRNVKVYCVNPKYGAGIVNRFKDLMINKYHYNNINFEMIGDKTNVNEATHNG